MIEYPEPVRAANPARKWRAVRRWLRHFRAQLVRAYQAFQEDDGELLAGGIAFFAVLSLAPMLVVALALASRVLGGRALDGVLVAELKPLIGGSAAQFVSDVMGRSEATGLSKHAAIIGAVITVYASSRLFIQVQSALNRVWRVGTRDSQNLRQQMMRMVKKRLLSFALVLGLGALLAVTTVTKTALSHLAHHLGLPDVPLIWHAADAGLTFCALVCALSAIYRVLPDLSIGFRHALRGGFITAVFLALGVLVVGVYLDSGVVASAFGAAGSLVVFMLSAYYGAIFFLFGAELTAASARDEGVLRHSEQAPPPA
ncbi:MAG: YihY/virulence factor BrkB family protein [Myxococcales bacterium]